ncbi:hypothetical protein K7X08_009818 [Anisodus acutangulus]|uniref:Uncharacterized protein n=1 Tax=Anisodus acutangulus TaxID=402998 RepID=A0A9Q1RTY6_9SOLA|nr:hypothetical protein K7X08_009818 [Anisodus acutangulus]
MILLVLGVVGVTYYAVVLTNYAPALFSGGGILDALIALAVLTDGEIPGTPGTLATTSLAFVFNLAFALSVLGFLIMHISLVAGNTTTIEAYEK